MTRIAIAAGCLAAAALTLTACGSSGSGTGGGTSPSSAPPSMSMSMSMPAAGGPSDGTQSSSDTGATSTKLIIKGFAYSGHLTVKPGEKVSVVNEDSAPHTVTSNDKKFDSGTVNPGGGTGTFTAPMQPGKYQFGCNFHPNMAGTLTVQG